MRSTAPHPVLAAAFVLSVLLFPTPRVWADDCPRTPVEEAGGMHRCYRADRVRGNVHVWTPGGYDAAEAVTVIYLHGYDIDEPRRGVPRYLDRAWDSHGLAGQFARSGLNALFIAVEGPTSDRQRPKWPSLASVLDSVRHRTGLVPPARAVAVAHSAGIFTAMRFLPDGRLAHVIAVDALYLASPKLLAAWYAGSKFRRLTIVGAQSLPGISLALAKRLECAVAESAADLESRSSRSVRCAAFVDAELGHMDAATGGVLLPAALGRIDLGVAKRPHRPPRHSDSCRDP